MIFDTLIRILVKVPNEILSKIPNIDISQVPVPDYLYTWLYNMTTYSKYFFPLELLSYIVSTMLELRLLRVQIAAFKFLKSQIPGMGGN